MRGRGWAMLGFWLGISASITANIEHSLAVSSALGAVIAAAFWPLALLVSLEVIARVNWAVGKQWWLLRWGGLVAVAGIAGAASYSHMASLLALYGENVFQAHIEPLGVDGLMTVCSAALLAIADNARRLNVVSIETMSPPMSSRPEDPLPEIATPPPTQKPATTSRNAQAHEAYRYSVAHGLPMTGKQLGEQFGRSDRWGRDRITEARSVA